MTNYKYNDGQDLYYGPVQDFNLFNAKTIREFKELLKKNDVEATVLAIADAWYYIKHGQKPNLRLV